MDTLASFGPYTLLRAIAATDDAVSFAARFEGGGSEGQLLALKVIRPEVTTNTAFAERMIAELKLAVRLNHVNVAQVFDVARHDGIYSVALEFVDGVPLSLIQQAVPPGQRALTTEVAAFICAEVCAGVAYAHGRRDERGQVLDIVHTRITPRTVLLSKSGLVKLVDFGLARATHETRPGAQDDSYLQYCAPELARRESYDHRADIFAIGALAYALLTGHTIYHGASGEDLKSRAARGYVPDILDVDSTVPEELAELVTRALSADPDRRFADATELRSGLAAWLRRSSPGFGRHRLKNYLQRLIPGATYQIGDDSAQETLHRKEFRHLDPDTLLEVTVETAAGRPSEKQDIRPLLEAPAVPRLEPLDVSRMTTGAHHTVREQAVAIARERGATGSSARVPTSARTQVMAPNPSGVRPTETRAGDTDETDRPERGLDASVDDAWDPLDVAVPTDREPPARSGAEGRARGGHADTQIDPSAVYDDSVARETLDAAFETPDDAAPRAARPGIVTAIVALMLLGFAAFGVRALIDQRTRDTLEVAAPQSIVFVTSRPQGARVLVDGAETGLTTPAPLRDLGGRSVEITVAMQGFDTPTPQTLDPRSPNAEVAFELVPAAHSVRIGSDPAGADVIHDGAVAGQTPMTLGPIRADYRQGLDVVLRMEGYRDELIQIDWAPGVGESSVRRTLQPLPQASAEEGAAR